MMPSPSASTSASPSGSPSGSDHDEADAKHPVEAQSVNRSCMSPDSISSPRAQAFAMLKTIRGDVIAELPLSEDLDVGDLRKRAAQFVQGSWQHISLFFGTENVTQQQALRVEDPDADVYAINHPEKSKWLRAFEKLRENSEETYLFDSTAEIFSFSCSFRWGPENEEIGVHNLLLVAPDEIRIDETICAAALRAAATRRHWRNVASLDLTEIVGHAHKLERDSTTAYLAAIVEFWGVSVFDWDFIAHAPVLETGFRVRDFPIHVRSSPSCGELARAALTIPSLTVWENDNEILAAVWGFETPFGGDAEEERQPECLKLAMEQYVCGNLLRDREFILSVAARGGDAFCLLLGYGFRPPVDFPPSAAAARTDFLPHQEQAATMFQAFRNDKEVVTALVELGGVFMLAHAADEIRGDPEVVAAAVAARRVSTGDRDVSAARKGAAMGLMFATEALRGDRGAVEKLVRLNGFALVAASRELQEDIELAAIAIAQAAGVFAHLPDVVRCREELALLAVSREGAQLEFVPDPGEAVARAAIENDARKAFPLVPEGLRSSVELAHHAARCGAFVLEQGGEEESSEEESEEGGSAEGITDTGERALLLNFELLPEQVRTDEAFYELCLEHCPDVVLTRAPDCGYRADLDPKLKRLTISAILRTCAKHPNFRYFRSRKAKRIKSAAGVLSRIPECDRDHFLSALGVKSCELVASFPHEVTTISHYLPTWSFCDAEIMAKLCGLDWFGAMVRRILDEGSGRSEALRDSADLVAAGVRGSGTVNAMIGSHAYSGRVVYRDFASRRLCRDASFARRLLLEHDPDSLTSSERKDPTALPFAEECVMRFFCGWGDRVFVYNRGPYTDVQFFEADQFLYWKDSLVQRDWDTFRDLGWFYFSENDFEDLHWDVENFAEEDRRSGGRLRSLAHLAVERGCNPQSRCLPASLRNDPTFKKVWEIYLRRWCGYRVIIDLGEKTDPQSAYAPTADKILDQFEDHTEPPVATFEEYLQLLDSAGLRAPDVWGADS